MATTHAYQVLCETDASGKYVCVCMYLLFYVCVSACGYVCIDLPVHIFVFIYLHIYVSVQMYIMYLCFWLCIMHIWLWVGTYTVEWLIFPCDNFP